MVQNWTDFEFVLTIILENRILKVFSAYLQELNQRAISSDDFDFKTSPKKKKKSKKGAKSVKSLAIESISDLPKSDIETAILSPKTRHSEESEIP